MSGAEKEQKLESIQEEIAQEKDKELALKEKLHLLREQLKEKCTKEDGEKLTQIRKALENL